MSIPAPTAVQPLAARLLQYQRERFPLAQYVPLITAFTFSAVAYSRMLNGSEGFIPLPRFLMGCFTAVVLFALLRVLDEHKDADVDRRYRPELPVPRGLVTRAELRAVQAVLLVLALGWNALAAPVLLLPLAFTLFWAGLMTAEFFVPEWLRARPAAYLLTHMAVMPLIDGYTTGLDWLAEGDPPSAGLFWFLLVTFLNGIIIEVGRKLRGPEDEREGVDTYTAAWGLRRAPVVWMAVLAAATATALAALRHIDASPVLAVLMAGAGAVALVPAVRFLQAPTTARARSVEQVSGVWTLFSYLILGAGPFLLSLL